MGANELERVHEDYGEGWGRMMSVLTITKTTIKQYKITQIALDFLTFDESYRRIRGNMKNKLFNCFSCKREFKDGEAISLIIITNSKNKVVCHDCGLEIEKELIEKEGK